MTLVSLFQIVASMSFAGSVVAAIILLAKGVMKDKLGAAWHYIIWVLLLVRLTVPAMPQSDLSIFNLFAAPAPNTSYTWEWDGGLLPGVAEDPAQTGATAPDHSTARQAGNAADILSLIWIGGAGAILLYTLGVNAAYLMKIRRKPRCMDGRIMGILNDCCDALHIHRRPALVCDTDRKAPALYGLIRPRILVDPQVLRGLTDDEVRHIFLHELAHMKRMDILANWITVTVTAMHWFNPVIWYAAYRMRQDREVACDAYVLACLNPDEHKQYGETIIRVLQSLSAPHWAPVAVGMAGNDKSTIKRRINMIKMFKKASFRWTALAVAIMLVIGVIALTNSPANASRNDQDPVPPSQEEQDPDVIVPEETATEETVPEETAPAEEEESGPQVQVPVDMDVVEATQEQVDQGHSPWQLSALAVTQTFVSLQVSPEGITGDFPIRDADLTVVSEDNETAVIAISGDITPIRTVYLKRLVRPDETGIWTVVGYDPVN